MKLAFVESVPAAPTRPYHHWLEEADYNVQRLRPPQIAVDLLSDSWGEIGDLGELPPAHGSDEPEAVFRNLYGYPFVTTVFRGRFAEALLAAALVRPGDIVAGNALFPSARFHIAARGAHLVEIGVSASRDLTSPAPFKGDLDITALERVLAQRQQQPVSCMWLEACVNALGGQPVSLENLRQVYALCRAAGVPVVLDGTRLLDNVLLARERDPECSDDPEELLREFTRHSDVCIMSAMKDFQTPVGAFIATRAEELHIALRDLVLAYGCGLTELQRRQLATSMTGEPFPRLAERLCQVRWLHDHLATSGVPVTHPVGGHAVLVDVARLLPRLPITRHPVQALAGALYALSGVRTGEHLLSPDQAQSGLRLLRLAVPVSRYGERDLDRVVRAFAAILTDADGIPGLRCVDRPPGYAGKLAARYALRSAIDGEDT